jgi:hypothetical protein
MKTWLQARITWMNNNIGEPTNCVNPILPNLVITKIHYNPLNQTNFTSDELEFFEITNNSNDTVDLTGVYIRELGISYKFPAGSTAAPNQQIILCSNPMKFTQFYGYPPFGGYTRTLSNKSYNIVLCDAFGNVIDEVHYEDSSPWPSAADGNGPYLCLNDVNSDNALPQNWSACGHVSIHEYGIGNLNLSVFPVPFGEQLNLFIEDYAIVNVTIYDMQGRLINNQEFVENQAGQSISLSTKSLDQGVYLVSVLLETGIVLTKSVVKQ